jgi:hypothetical protein
VTKSVLSALAQVLPDDGHNHLTKLDIRRGWVMSSTVDSIPPCLPPQLGGSSGIDSEMPSAKL